MHILGNFSVNGEAKRPFIAAIALNAADGTPSYALIAENEEVVPYVSYKGINVATEALLDSVSHDCTRPQSGGGIIRRTITLSIKTDNVKGAPFYRGAITKKFYQGGQTYDDIIFAIYASDASHPHLPLEDAWFLGVYRIDRSVDWKEEDGVTDIPLMQILEEDRTKVGTTDQEIPEQFFLFNPWFDEPLIPKVFGRVPRIKMLNIFPSVSVKAIAGAISGVIESAYTPASTTILLERFADQASGLRQLIAIGGTVAIRMNNGEVIVGSLAFNNITNEVTLTITARNQPYAKTKAYTYVPGESYTDWSNTSPAFGGGYLPTSWSMMATVLLNGKDIVQDSSGWLRTTINYYNAAAFNRNVEVVTSVELTGWADEAAGVLNHEAFEYAAHPPSVVSAYFSSTSRSGGAFPPIGFSQPWMEYIYFSNVPKEVELFFVDPAIGAGSGVIGEPWSIVNIYPASVEYKAYIRNGFSHFDNQHVYVEGSGRLIKVPTANIVSVSDNVTKFGVTNLAEVVLTAAPIDLGLDATSNIIYVDALYRTATNEARPERVLYEILKESPLLAMFAGSSITSFYETDTWMPYTGVHVSETTTLSTILDRYLFECGATLEWQRGKYQIRRTTLLPPSQTIVDIGGVDYVRPEVYYINGDVQVENTARIKTGDLISVVKDGFEVIPLYYTPDYGDWQDPFYKRVRPAVNRAIRPKDFEFNYLFKYINDANSANYAIGLSLSAGHASGLASIDRDLMTELTSEAFIHDVLDTVILNDFPIISDDDTDAVIVDGKLHYLKPADDSSFIMGALCVIERMSYRFNVDQPATADVTFKQTQLFVNARGISVYKPPYPPLLPPNPPGPGQPPGGGGGSSSEYGNGGGGGTYDPMLLSWTQPAAIEINSTDYEESPFTVTVNDALKRGGFSYSLEILATTGGPEILAGAAFIGGANAGVGTIDDRDNDAYVAPIHMHTLMVNHLWFFNQPPALISRPLILRLRRQVYYQPFDAEGENPTYELTEDKVVQITLKPIFGVTVS